MPLANMINYTCLTVLIGLFFAFTSAATEVYAHSTIPSPIETPTPTATPTPVEKSEEEKRLEEEKRILGLRKDIATYQKDIAEAQKNELAAKYPAPTSSPLTGETKINDNALIESQMIAYAAMAKSANRIVGGIKTVKDKDGNQITVKHLGVFNEPDINLLLSYKVANNQIEVIRQGYCALLRTSQTNDQCLAFNRSLAISTIGKSVLGAFVDLTALLRTNVEIKGNTFDIDESPLVAEVFRAGRKLNGFGAGANFYYPKMFPPDINPDANSTILANLDAVNTLRTRAGRIIGEVDKKTKEVDESKGKVKSLKTLLKQAGLQKADLETKKVRLLEAYCPPPSRRQALLGNQNSPCRQMQGEVRERFFELRDEIKRLDENEKKLTEDLRTEQTNTGDLEKQLRDLLNNLKLDESSASDPNKFSVEDALAQLKARNAQLDKFIESLITVSATGVNPLTNFIKAENLKNALPEDSHWLQLKVLKAGGNNRTKTNLIWDVFTGGNRLSHSGGVVVQYILFDAKGKSVASDTITEYMNYIKSSKVKDLPDITIDDSAPNKKSKEEKGVQ